jgi:hypothetical protein
MTTRVVLVMTGLTLALAGPGAAQRADVPIPADARRTIAAANAAWLQAMEDQDAAAIAAEPADRDLEPIGPAFADRYLKV